ncbi:MAG: enoyl-CoA hydratase/isomerase family protein [Vicinamibacterales bacterium]
MELSALPVGPDATVVTLPECLSAEAVARLAAAFDAAVAGPAHVVLLAGADERTFCTGLALRESDDPIDTDAFAALLASLVDAPKATLAVVDGQAIGGGLGLAAACDWVLATSRSTFALPELLWGLVPAMIWPIVTLRMGHGSARRWTIEAHTHGAADAMAAGLVDEVADAGAEPRAVRRALRMLQRADANALRTLRQWVRDSRELPWRQAVARGAAMTAHMARSPQARARIAAFARGEAPWA